ncbi:MAG: lipid-binding SYLF domain-containing protein [Steroidobacteraceae bacterium]
MKFFSMFLAAMLATTLVATPAAAVTREEATIDQALIVLRELQAIPDTQIPDLLLSRAEGIVILPANVKVGLIFGARFGNGVMLVRNAERRWSNPVFVSTGGGSWGFQAGGQVSDIVLVLTTRESVEGITDGKLTLGADASVAAGPVGRTAMASTSLTFDSEVYAYSKSKGLFAGVSLEGNGIFIGKKANKRFYDGKDSAAEILASKEAPPAPAPALVAEVTRITSNGAQSVADEAAQPAGPATPPAEAKTYPMPDPEPGAEPGGS